MAEQRNALPFEPKRASKGQKPEGDRARQEAIPRFVADRMARRVLVFTGLPSLAGMGVFVGSYVLVTRGMAEIPPGVTLVTSGLCFLLGLVGLSFGVLTSSWEIQAGSLLGLEHFRPNLKRMRDSIRAQSKAKQQP